MGAVRTALLRAALAAKPWHGAPGLLGSSRGVWTDAPGAEEAPLNFYDSTIEEYARQPVEKLTLRQMLEFGQNAWADTSKLLASARFCQAELPKRLARRLLDLQLLPHLVVANPHIARVYSSYYHAFNTLRAAPPVTTARGNDAFSALLRRLVDEHAPLLDALASGLREVRSKPIVGEALRLDAFLENMLRSRISRRVLAEQHINLNNGRPGYIGVICTDLSLAESVEFAAQRCRQVCLETYGAAPEVRLSGDLRLRVAYIPAHFDYMLYELLKNAARATVERHHLGHSHSQHGGGGSSGGGGGGLSSGFGGLGGGSGALGQSGYGSSSEAGGGGGGNGEGSIPPIHVRVCGSEGEVTIRVSDQGGGLPPGADARVWEFGYSTNMVDARSGWQVGGGNKGDAVGGGSSAREGLGLDSGPGPFAFGAAMSEAESTAGMGRYRMAGLGFGLPLSRLYARYFGGDLRLVNLRGYGVDAYLSLRRLEGGEWQEGLAEQGTQPFAVSSHFDYGSEGRAGDPGPPGTAPI